MAGRAIMRAAATLLSAAGLVLASNAGAWALPENCSTTQDLRSASSLCLRGTGEHRVRVFAINQVFGGTAGRTFLGPWVPVGQVSTVTVDPVFVITGNSPAVVDLRD